MEAAGGRKDLKTDSQRSTAILAQNQKKLRGCGAQRKFLFSNSASIISRRDSVDIPATERRKKAMQSELDAFIDGMRSNS